MSESKLNKNFLQVLRGEAVDGVPFWFMRQAGRYLPEYRSLREEKGGFLAMAFDSDVACEITMQPVRRFGMDAAIIFSDILTVPMALGQDLRFEAGEGPKLGELNIDRLRFEGEALEKVYEAIAKTRKRLVSEEFHQTALIGFAGAPWTVATYMVEGGSSRDFVKTKMMAYSDPENFGKLIDILVDATAQYLIRQVDAGAEALQIFDSWAGVLDQSQFHKWSIVPTKRIIEIVRDSYPDIPILGFPKGAGLNMLRYAQETGITAIQIDSSTPTDWARNVLQPLMPVQGNLDPLCLLAGGDALKLGMEKILNDLAGGNFIFNLGHGIHKETPIAHVEQMVEILRNG